MTAVAACVQEVTFVVHDDAAVGLDGLNVVFEGLVVIGWWRTCGGDRVSRAFAGEVSFAGCAERRWRAAVFGGRLLAVEN